MSLGTDRCGHSEITCTYLLQALSPPEIAAAEAHIASCADCQRELKSLRPLVDRFAAWPTDVLRAAPSLRDRLANRLTEEISEVSAPPSRRSWSEPEWQQVAPGIECQVLANDDERGRVSMLVRLAADTSYPAHTHAGAEELHLLDGELWINGRRLLPGDYNYGAPGETDERVWSEIGCTCLLLTSTRDLLF